MARCQFIYLRYNPTASVNGGQCHREAHFVNQTLCRLHRKRASTVAEVRRLRPIKLMRRSPMGNLTSVRSSSQAESESDSFFPRMYNMAELKAWVEEARGRTDPQVNERQNCVVCGQSFNSHCGKDLTAVTVDQLCHLKDLAAAFVDTYYADVPIRHFRYFASLPQLDGLPLCRSGFFANLDNAAGALQGSSVIGHICQTCLKDLCQKNQVPSLALANGLWTGVGECHRLSDLTWIEEKLIARVHVSIQMFKCRLFPHFKADEFHPQARAKGHVISHIQLI